MATRILLIDDDEVDRAAVRRSLMKSGLDHQLVEAKDGETGLRLAAERPFDCILLDYRLPDVDAFAALARLLSSEGGNHAVIMLTGEADGDVALRLMRAGALDYMSKFEATPSSLVRAIRYATARRGFLTELDLARREAEEKSQALDALNRQKTLLFSIIAHDLRNPFQALLGLSTLLSQNVASLDMAAVGRRAEGIKQAAGQAYALMESLFAWASLQMETAEVVFEEVDLDEIMRETVEGIAEAASAKTLTVHATGSGLRVQAQRDMLLTVLRNLVSNAVKFTHPGGSVTLSAEGRGGAVAIAVADTGVGIPAAKVDDLLRLDRRVTTNGTAGERGSGFGLLLCRDLVERLGGELGVTSVPDQGTTFDFTLPGHSGAERPRA
ncbi:MAG TPA: hybrid sensor histidine kinase/response regulator [Lichenihabitans sp.]|jgi:signal transduction histidine kinase|nr:hybrid sensor histidine kinase/response regulator [Lichenihabitans sp.]